MWCLVVTLEYFGLDDLRGCLFGVWVWVDCLGFTLCFVVCLCFCALLLVAFDWVVFGRLALFGGLLLYYLFVAPCFCDYYFRLLDCLSLGVCFCACY